MKALYVMKYQGQEGIGAGVLYVGGGHVLGVDIGECRYRGTYVEESGRLKGKGTISSPPSRVGTLVTGKTLHPGETLPLEVDWPENLDDGERKGVSVDGNQVFVVFEKIGDIPD